MEGYTAEQLAELLTQIGQAYTTEKMAELLALLLEALRQQSPQIYEKFRELQELLKKAAALFVEKEQISMGAFPAPHMKGIAGEDAANLKRAGEILKAACEEKLLSAERYADMAEELAGGRAWKAD